MLVFLSITLRTCPCYHPGGRVDANRLCRQPRLPALCCTRTAAHRQKRLRRRRPREVWSQSHIMIDRKQQQLLQGNPRYQCNCGPRLIGLGVTQPVFLPWLTLSAVAIAAPRRHGLPIGHARALLCRGGQGSPALHACQGRRGRRFTASQARRPPGRRIWTALAPRCRDGLYACKFFLYFFEYDGVR